MKTTLILKDDLVKQAKSRAALQGCSFSAYMEQCLEKALEREAGGSVKDWIYELPEIPQSAVSEVDEALRDADFNKIDPEMWR